MSDPSELSQLLQRRSQPQWRAGMSPREQDQYRTAREASINGLIARLNEERSQNGIGPRGQVLTSPFDREVTMGGLPGPRYHPVSGEEDYHSGNDMPAPLGTPIYAASSGNVVYAGHYSRRGGEMLMIYDDDNRLVSYAHMPFGATIGLRPGDRVEQGQRIGVVGNTGSSTGSHLHFGIRRMSPEQLAQSAASREQLTQLAGLTVQPLNIQFIPDPSRNYLDWEIINAPINGRTYAPGAPVPPSEPAIRFAAQQRAREGTSDTIRVSFPHGVSGGEPAKTQPTSPELPTPSGSTPGTVSQLLPPR